MTRFDKYIFVTLFLILCADFSFGQKFERFKDQVNECNVIKYYDSDFQVIIEKCFPFDSTQAPYFKIGLYIIKVNMPFDLFMKNGAIIAFEDGTKIKIKDKVSLLYKGNDSNQISVVHQLDSSELELLCTKPINYFKVTDYSKEFDKWQRADLLKVIQKLRSEK